MPRPPPPGHGLDHDGKPVALGKFDGHLLALFARRQHFGSGNRGNTGLGHDPAGDHLAPHVDDHLRRRTDEDQAGIGALLGKIGVFGQESIAGVDGFGPGLVRGLDDPVDAEVVPAGTGTDADRFVRPHDVHGGLIGFLIDRDRLDPQFLGRAHDADGDFASVCNQQLLKHIHSLSEEGILRGPGTGTPYRRPVWGLFNLRRVWGLFTFDRSVNFY